jgi:hypothetical protein
MSRLESVLSDEIPEKKVLYLYASPFFVAAKSRRGGGDRKNIVG